MLQSDATIKGLWANFCEQLWNYNLLQDSAVPKSFGFNTRHGLGNGNICHWIAIFEGSYHTTQLPLGEKGNVIFLQKRGATLSLNKKQDQHCFCINTYPSIIMTSYIFCHKKKIPSPPKKNHQPFLQNSCLNLTQSRNLYHVQHTCLTFLPWNFSIEFRQISTV